MKNPLFSYSPIVERPRLRWPNGARVAFYIGLNIEHYAIDRPSTSIFGGTAGLVPDPLNYGWRDYAPRVGIWRMIDALDRLEMRATALVNSEICAHYPQIISAGRDRDWCWVAHGQNNSTFQSGITPDAERTMLTDTLQTISSATGKPVRGWLGPALTETFETARIGRELGLSYVLDWCNDDQPYRLSIPGMLSVPYSIELNDITLFVGKNLSGEDFYRIVVDQFDQLYKDGATTGRVMALCLHPFVINQPFRHKYLVRALNYIAHHSHVWLTTSDEIASYYLAQSDQEVRS